MILLIKIFAQRDAVIASSVFQPESLKNKPLV
jgi:hypothetical protein